MKKTVEIEVPDNKYCGEYVLNYSHDGTFFGCDYFDCGCCLIYKSSPKRLEYQKDDKWQGSSAKIKKLKECKVKKNKVLKKDKTVITKE